MTNLSVSIERIKEDLLDLSEIGKNPRDRGIYRMAFSEADLAGKDWLENKMTQAGLKTSRDGVANISGVLGNNLQEPRIVVGSHIDTVPCAGMLDGSLGVVVGLECIRILQEQKVSMIRPVELIAFSDEEGRFGGTVGSEAFVGELSRVRLETARDLDGVRLVDLLRKQGLSIDEALRAKRNADDLRAYLELHIEQGPVLDNSGLQVGIVDHITGLRSWSITLQGETNHAGTTPMEYRKDALLGLADFAHEIGRILEEVGTENSRATVGKAEILPGAPNSVPGRVDFSLDFRDPATAILTELSTAFDRTLLAICRRRGLASEIHAQGEIAPVAADHEIVDLLTSHAKSLNISHKVMPSGAAHDAQLLGKITPMGMIFVPSKGGLSHSPAEATDWEDIEAGANLLLHALLELSSS